MSCDCNTNPCGCAPQPPACNCPPSPTPPWARASQSPLRQTLVDTTVPIVLDPDVVYLNQPNPPAPAAALTNNMVLPNGNYPGQFFRVMIPSGTLANTATWILTGAYAGGYTHLTFDTTRTVAMLQWDGAGWQKIGGNASLS